MAQITMFVKDPDAVLDYGFDWSSWLQSGETISQAVWTVPAGLTQQSQSESTTATVIWLAGGTIGAEYFVSCKVTTSAGRVDERTLKIAMRNR